MFLDNVYILGQCFQRHCTLPNHTIHNRAFPHCILTTSPDPRHSPRHPVHCSGSLWLIYDFWDRGGYTASTDTLLLLLLNATASMPLMHAWNMARQPCFYCRLYCRGHVLFDTHFIHIFSILFFIITRSTCQPNMLRALCTCSSTHTIENRQVHCCRASNSASFSCFSTLPLPGGNPMMEFHLIICARE